MSEYLHKLAGELRINEQRLEDHHTQTALEEGDADELEALFDRMVKLRREVETALEQGPGHLLRAIEQIEADTNALGRDIHGFIERTEQRDQ